jgi:hypothetical protein
MALKVKIDKLDRLFSEYIRRRAILRKGGCEYCGKQVKWTELQCSHFIGRRKRSTRYDPRNAVGGCFSCHIYYGENPYEHTEFFGKLLGTEELEKLIIRGNTPMKIDREAVEAHLKELLHGIKEAQ